MMADLRAAGDTSPSQGATRYKSHLRPHPKGGSVPLLASPMRQTETETSFLVSKKLPNPGLGIHCLKVGGFGLVF